MKTAKRRLCSLITRSLLRDRCCLLVSQALLLDLNWRGNGHWKGLAKLYLMCVGAEMLTVLWGEAEEGFTAPLQCDCGLAGNFSDHRRSLSSSVTVFGFSRQTICLISRCMPLITPQLICFLPPHPVPLCSPLPAQLPPWTTGTPTSPYPPQQAGPSRTTPNHHIPHTDVRAQPQCLQENSSKVIPKWEERTNMTWHKSGVLQKAFNFPWPAFY